MCVGGLESISCLGISSHSINFAGRYRCDAGALWYINTFTECTGFLVFQRYYFQVRWNTFTAQICRFSIPLSSLSSLFASLAVSGYISLSDSQAPKIPKNLRLQKFRHFIQRLQFVRQKRKKLKLLQLSLYCYETIAQGTKKSNLQLLFYKVFQNFDF